MKILIAEDDAALQYVARKLMRRWGYNFDMASNGQEAVEQAKINEGEYDLCLMDIDMPIMNGLEATQIIRQKLKYFPIMALTSHSMSKDKFLEMGMDDFLGKPYGMDELYGKINELMVKTYQFEINGKDIVFQKEMPMDQQHAAELRELKSKGFVKVKFNGVEPTEVILYKNIINKIVHDFNIKNQLVSIFLNHDPEKPTRCIFFKKSCCIPQVYLQQDDYEKAFIEEKQQSEEYPNMPLKDEE